MMLYQMEKTTLLNRGGIADLPLLGRLLAFCQKFREPSFWEVIDSFLLAYGSFAASKNDFYELWQQHRQWKTMEMSEASLDTYNEGY